MQASSASKCTDAHETVVPCHNAGKPQNSAAPHDKQGCLTSRDVAQVHLGPAQAVPPGTKRLDDTSSFVPQSPTHANFVPSVCDCTTAGLHQAPTTAHILQFARLHATKTAMCGSGWSTT
eukprot:365763-Chlamydomonas_euryale.AAC.13